jgi:hypothetical protein
LSFQPEAVFSLGNSSSICHAFTYQNAFVAFVNSSGVLAIPSDESLKKSIQKKKTNQKYLDRIMNTNFYSYVYNSDAEERINLGVLWQEVDKLYEGNLTNKKRTLILDEKGNQTIETSPEIKTVEYSTLYSYHILAFQQFVKASAERELKMNNRITELELKLSKLKL